jgi:hypothetical protein
MAVLASFSIFDACGMAAVSLRPLLFAVIDAAVPISCSNRSSSSGGGLA